jgi:hypothetical protein
MIFKIKRKLAEFGLGDQLLKLFKTSDEIKKMKEYGKIVTKFRPSTIYNSHIRKNKNGRFRIMVRIGINYQFVKGAVFDSESRAKEWGLWNYKGDTNNWKIVEEESVIKDVINK